MNHAVIITAALTVAALALAANLWLAITTDYGILEEEA